MDEMLANTLCLRRRSSVRHLWAPVDHGISNAVTDIVVVKTHDTGYMERAPRMNIFSDG